MFTPSTAARSRAGGSRSPGFASPSAIARRISAATCSKMLGRFVPIDLDVEHRAMDTSTMATRVPTLPLGLDPLIAEAKQLRACRRQLFALRGARCSRGRSCDLRLAPVRPLGGVGKRLAPKSLAGRLEFAARNQATVRDIGSAGGGKSSTPRRTAVLADDGPAGGRGETAPPGWPHRLRQPPIRVDPGRAMALPDDRWGPLVDAVPGQSLAEVGRDMSFVNRNVGFLS